MFARPSPPTRYLRAPPSMPRIPEKLRQDRREAIIQAAVDSLAEYGYQGTSMRTIAEAVGLTKGGLYPYFPNKDAILLAVADRYLEHVVARLQPRAGVEPARQLAEYLDDFEAAFHDARTVSARRGVLDLWLAAADRPAVRRSIEKRFAAVGEGLAAIVRRAQDEGTFRRDVDPELVAGLVLAARDGMLFQKVKLRAPVRVRELTELLKRLLLDALAPHAVRSMTVHSTSHPD
jgi:TetR/AcrR family transcriptional regulator, transcriptional repressor of aconitase